MNDTKEAPRHRGRGETGNVRPRNQGERSRKLLTLHMGKLRTACEHESAGVRAQRLLEEAKPYHPVFAPYGSPLELALDVERAPSTKGTWIDEAVGAVLYEHQQAPHGAWTSSMLVAFYPGLVTLLERLQTSVHDEDDRRALGLMAYCHAFATLKEPLAADRIPMRIRQAAQRYAFLDVRVKTRQHVREHDLTTEALERGCFEVFANARTDRVDVDFEGIVDLQREIAKSKPQLTSIDLVVPNEDVTTLWDTVRKLCPELPLDEQRRFYEALRRKLHRTGGESERRSFADVVNAVAETLKGKCA